MLLGDFINQVLTPNPWLSNEYIVLALIVFCGQ
jgi:hypothetical protein